MGKPNKNNAAVEETAALNKEEVVTETVTEEVTETVETEEAQEAVSEEVTETVETEEAQEAVSEEVTETVENVEVHEAEVIASNVFVAEDGTEYELTVKKFTFNKKTYTAEEAIENHKDVLEQLAGLKSFILKAK